MFANVLLHLLCNKFCFSEVLLSKKFKIILKSQYQIWVIYFRRHISVFSSMCFKFLQNIFSEKISAWLLLIIAPHKEIFTECLIKQNLSTKNIDHRVSISNWMIKVYWWNEPIYLITFIQKLEFAFNKVEPNFGKIISISLREKT